MKKMFVLTNTFIIKELYAVENLYVGIKEIKANDGRTYKAKYCFASYEEARSCGEREVAYSISRIGRMLENIRNKEKNLSRK